MFDLSVLKRDKLSCSAFFIACVWIIAQFILLLVFGNHTQVPDAQFYMREALFAYKNDVLYPSQKDIYNMIVHSPGMVNYLVGVYALFGSFKAAMVLNIVMNIIIVYEMFYLGRFFFNSRVASIAVIIYCTICSFWFIPLHVLSDHPSYFLFLSGFCLSLQKKWYWVILAGFFYAIGFTIRPTVLAFLVTSIIFLIVNKRSWSYYLLLIIPYWGTLYGIGKYNESKIGIYTNTSDMGGFALMHSANEKTFAGPDMSFVLDSQNSGYIAHAEQYTFAEKDSIWKKRAVQWIKKNPKRYISLMPQRFFRIYALDSWSTEDLWSYNDYRKAVLSDNPSRALLMRHLRQMAWSIPYYCMLCLFIFSLYRNRKYLLSKKGIMLVLTLLYTGTTFFFIAEHRGHYAFLFPMILWAAYGVDVVIRCKKDSLSCCHS